MTMAKLMENTAGNVTFVDGGLYAVDYESPGYLSPVLCRFRNLSVIFPFALLYPLALHRATSLGSEQLVFRDLV